MNRQTLRLVLLVSCAHALVHVYELAFASVEQLVAAEYDVGKEAMGLLANCWRLPFGLGAMAAGYLVDRLGAKWMLVSYLIGCAGCSAALRGIHSLDMLYPTMFLMGSFASIYHPAGLALISHETDVSNRPLALGYHGILGSIGIASAPFVAGLALDHMSWRDYYLLLSVPGFALALWFAFRLVEHHRQAALAAGGSTQPVEEDRGRYKAFFVLTAAGGLNGLVYAAVMTFLPRYLNGAGLSYEGIRSASLDNYLTGAVLSIGIIGQYTAGRLGKGGNLERLLTATLFVTAILLVGMAVAEGSWRLLAAGGVSLVIFMQQPVYNSLVAQYIPKARRSLGFGFSNTMSFGVGSFGASLAGFTESDFATFGMLSLITLAAAITTFVLWKFFS